MGWFVAVPALVGLGALLFGTSGCSSSNATNDAAGSASAPNASGSSYAPAAPPPVGSGLPPERPNPLLTRAAPIDIGAAPAGRNETQLREWAGEEAINRRYLPEYNTVYPGLYSERRQAIEATIRLIDSETRANPLRVSYTVGGTPSNPVTIEDPIQIFVRRLVATAPEASRDEVRREAEAAIRALRGGAGASGTDAHPEPRPTGGDSPRPRSSGSGNPSTPVRPAGRPNGLGGTAI